MIRINVGIVTVVASLAVLACSSPAPVTSGDDSGGERTKSADTNGGDDGSSSGGSSSGGDTSAPAADAAPNDPAPGGTCSAAQGVEACYACCDAKNPDGMAVYEDAWLACACAPGVCATACAQSACAATPSEPADGDACDTCLAQADQCDDQAEAACEASPACLAGFQCALDSGCEGDEDD
ncbi:MAG: hypothetical protein KIS78_05400 [Labilithrix sp.]|nr:hypothetical protein [Labilithrix sp.]MCW5831872.1 hypothetical protein [Labilithrix sp.]